MYTTMYTTVLSLLLAGTATAQITLPPYLNNGINLSNDMDACMSAGNQVLSCADQVGGFDSLLDADPDELMACACCADGSALAPAYSSCYEYLSDEGAGLTDYAPYQTLYSVCSLQGGPCSATGSPQTTSSTEEDESSITATATETGLTGSETEIFQLTSTAELTASVPSACFDMLDMFSSCVAETKGFSDLPFASQAPCYCCTTSRGQVGWTDELDGYASECADWASTGEPSTIYPGASRFASFCENFSDACEATSTMPTDPTTTETEAEATDDSTATEDDDSASRTNESGSEPTDAGVQLRVSALAGLLVVVAFAAVW